MVDFHWTEKTERAALLVAEGELTDVAIADDAGVTRQTLWVWRKNPAFMARVEEHLEAFRSAVRRRGIAILERRVDALNDRWRKLQQVISERAQAPDMQEVPGGKTGLLVHTVKSVGSGETAQVVDEFTLDAALLRELREHEKQAAQELGQWIDKSQVEQVTKAYVTVGPDDL